MLVEANVATRYDGLGGGVVDKHGIAIVTVSYVIADVCWIFQVARPSRFWYDDRVCNAAEHEELVRPKGDSRSRARAITLRVWFRRSTIEFSKLEYGHANSCRMLFSWQ